MTEMAEICQFQMAKLLAWLSPTALTSKAAWHDSALSWCAARATRYTANHGQVWPAKLSARAYSKCDYSILTIAVLRLPELPPFALLFILWRQRQTKLGSTSCWPRLLDPGWELGYLKLAIESQTVHTYRQAERDEPRWCGTIAPAGYMDCYYGNTWLSWHRLASDCLSPRENSSYQV